jgi:23S rRNA (uracil1939-C5)-methyltransferase
VAQHLGDSAYALWKRRLVQDALARRRLDGGVVEQPVAVEPGSRRRAEFTLIGRRSGIVAGFLERGSHAVVDLMECPVMRPELAAILPALREALAGWLGAGARAEAMASLGASGIDLILTLPAAPDLTLRERLGALAAAQDWARLSWRLAGGTAEPLAARRPFGLRFADVWVEPPPGAFLQASEAGERAIIAAVLAGVGAAGRIADLYAGCGSLSLPMAKRAQVHAVEADAALLAALRRATGAVPGRLSLEERDLERSPLTDAELERFDAVVFDPPRAGAVSQAVQLARSRVGRVVAVSCHPGSFARDARILVDGGYRLERVLPIDQFLWSHHIELVGQFVR